MTDRIGIATVGVCDDPKIEWKVIGPATQQQLEALKYPTPIVPIPSTTVTDTGLKQD